MGKMKFYEYLEQENITPLDIITDAERREDLCHKIKGCHECPLKIPSCYLDRVSDETFLIDECNDRERNLIENNMKRLMEKASKKKNKSKWRPKIGKRYYYPSVDTGTPYAEPGTWSGIRRLEVDRYNAGMICRTKGKALELAQKMLAVAKERDCYV